MWTLYAWQCARSYFHLHKYLGSFLFFLLSNTGWSVEKVLMRRFTLMTLKIKNEK